MVALLAVSVQQFVGVGLIILGLVFVIVGLATLERAHEKAWAMAGVGIGLVVLGAAVFAGQAPGMCGGPLEAPKVCPLR